MPKFTIINSTDELTWINVLTCLKSNDRIVNEKGETVGADYRGRQYRIITENQRVYSTQERIGRCLLGIATLICTLDFSRKTCGKSFYKKREMIRFGVEQTRFRMERGTLVYMKPHLLYESIITKSQTLHFNSIEDCVTQQIDNVASLAKNNECEEKEFVEFILSKDSSGIPRICTLNFKSLLGVLNLIKEQRIPISLNDKTLQGESLFTLWAGRGYVEITQLLLELNPSLIEQRLKESVFITAALNGFLEEANLLLDAMERRHIALSPEEVWIKKAIRNDDKFSEKAFAQLPKELKIKIFFVANAFASLMIVKKLKTLGMGTEPLFWPGAAIFSFNMDVITTRNVMERFLMDLRKQGLLLTEQEFNQLDKERYIKKSDQINRILGRNFAEKLIKEFRLTHIKVPKKIAVIKKDLKTISFQIDHLQPQSNENQIEVYAERVTPVDRKFSLSEALEFMLILEKVGYQDFLAQNYLWDEHNIYLIDTEAGNFQPLKPQFESIKTIKDLLSPADAEQFLIEYNRRKKAADKEKKTRQAQETQRFYAGGEPYTNLVDAYGYHDFNFSVDDLIRISPQTGS